MVYIIKEIPFHMLSITLPFVSVLKIYNRHDSYMHEPGSKTVVIIPH
jgi:hypothetical protein